MTNRERIWKRARSWVAGWNSGKCTPTLEMAYRAGWQAAMREAKKQQFDLSYKALRPTR